MLLLVVTRTGNWCLQCQAMSDFLEPVAIWYPFEILYLELAATRTENWCLQCQSVTLVPVATGTLSKSHTWKKTASEWLQLAHLTLLVRGRLASATTSLRIPVPPSADGFLISILYTMLLSDASYIRKLTSHLHVHLLVY